MGTLRRLGFALALAVLPATASAQPKKQSPQQLQQAGDLVKKAISKSQAGDHQLAIELYLQAYNISPAAILLSNIGAEYQQISKPIEAVKYFCKYLDAEPTGSNATYATAQVKSLQIQLGNDVDDKDVCKPIPKPVVKPPPPVITTTPPAGEGSGSAVDVTGTEPNGPPPAPSHGNKKLQIAGIVVGGVGLITLGVGLDFALKSKSLNDQINAHKLGDPWPGTIDGVPIGEWDAQGHTWNKEAIAFSIVGGVVTIAGTAMFLVGRSSGSSEHTDRTTAIVPSAGPHGAGVMMFGSF